MCRKLAKGVLFGGGGDGIDDAERRRDCERLNANPQIRNRIASLQGVVEDRGGKLRLADVAEARLIEEIRQMRQEAMQASAERLAKKFEK